ncbi:hypothetical protein A2U01_0117343 [Trifolium medium]|uniref:Uncharacterized protein n=1 Tax=Trifolium medium TaxID=97028 RepID=A0A392W5Y7_9FABA|nr:hypothetical protein [Trifolium medium]
MLAKRGLASLGEQRQKKIWLLVAQLGLTSRMVFVAV